MSDAETVEQSDPLKSVADAMEAAVLAAKDGATQAREAAANAFPAASATVSKWTYNACYAISYGIVFPTVFVAKSLPRNNAIVHGLTDGAKAAIDMVDELKSHKP